MCGLLHYEKQFDSITRATSTLKDQISSRPFFTYRQYGSLNAFQVFVIRSFRGEEIQTIRQRLFLPYSCSLSTSDMMRIL